MKTTTAWVCSILLLATTACDNSDSSASASDADPAGGTSSDPAPPLAEELCEETDREVIVAWTGPGASPDGELLELGEGPYWLHSTWAVAAAQQESEFLAHATAVIAATQEIPGLVAVTASRSERCGGLRTLGVWESQEAMFQLLSSPAHIEAVNQAARVSSIGKTTSWEGTVEEAQSLDWDMGRAKLLEVPTSPAYE